MDGSYSFQSGIVDCLSNDVFLSLKVYSHLTCLVILKLTLVLLGPFT